MTDNAHDAPKVGRPSSYDPAYCGIVEEVMSRGLSKMAAAGEIGVCLNTLKAWMIEHPEFLTAVKRGEAKRALRLEIDLLDAETGPRATTRMFALKNAAPEEWKDKQLLELGGEGGGPIKADITVTRRIVRPANPGEEV